MTKRSKLWIIAAVTLLALAGVGVTFNQSQKAGGAPKKDEAPPLEFAPAELVAVEPAKLVHELVLPGSVQAVNQATVRAKLSAEVRRVLVREGETVAAGQVLAEFDTSQLRAQLAERQATYDSARAQLASTDRTRQANAQLVKQNFISQNAFDTADSNYQAQLATVAAARAALEQTQIQVSDAIVRAPIAGIIAKRHVQPGEKVGYDAPLLAIVDLGKLEVQAQAPVADVPLLSLGMATEVQIEGLPGRNFAARLDRINPATEAGTRMLNVYVSLPNEERLVKAGMFARVLVAIVPQAPVPSLPVASVRSDGVQSYVWVIADGKLARRNVEIGRRDERAQRVEIRSALAAKEPVLSGKFDNLKEGLAARSVSEAVPPVAVEPAAATPAVQSATN